MNKKLDARKVLKEVERLQNKLEKSTKGNWKFDQIHQEVLLLCENVFDRKKEYEQIEVPFPRKFFFKNDIRGPQLIDMTPNFDNDLKKLADDVFEILDKIEKLYALRVKLSPKPSAPNSGNNDVGSVEE